MYMHGLSFNLHVLQQQNRIFQQKHFDNTVPPLGVDFLPRRKLALYKPFSTVPLKQCLQIVVLLAVAP